jgi:hypothetical protein
MGHRSRPAGSELALELLEIGIARLALALFGRRLLVRRRRPQVAEHDEVERFVAVLVQRLDRDPDEPGLVAAFELAAELARGGHLNEGESFSTSAIRNMLATTVPLVDSPEAEDLLSPSKMS